MAIEQGLYEQVIMLHQPSSTRDPDLYKKLFQSHNNTQDINTFRFFQVSIRNAKCVESFKFQNDAQNGEGPL